MSNATVAASDLIGRLMDRAMTAEAELAALRAENAELRKDAQRLRVALASTILWALDAEGGYTEMTKRYYEWASAVAHEVDGNPLHKELLDAALEGTKETK